MNFSIITCTYNPNILILKKLFKAIDLLKVDNNIKFEWILVDNKSSRPINEISFINNELTLHSNYKCINENSPGLTNARLAGIREAKYNWIVFFDDDNEPQNNYLCEASLLIEKYKNVGCWGPGKIKVVYPESNPTKWVINKSEYFQELDLNDTFVMQDVIGKQYCPFGTGMVVKKDSLKEYIDNYCANKYNIRDRTKNSLISGGDYQMVLSINKSGEEAGVSPNLMLTHNISSKKATFRYIIRLQYQLSSSYLKVVEEVYPGMLEKQKTIGNLEAFKAVLFLLRNLLFRTEFRDLALVISKKIGEINAVFILYSKRPNLIIYLFEKLIKV